MENGRLVSSKWTKQRVLSRNPAVAAHIPETRLYSWANAHAMLARYGVVVLKPVVGTGGIGLIKASRAGGVWRCTSGMKTTAWPTFAQMMHKIDRLRRGRRYLIQRGIHLAKIGGRPIDYRVKIVKREGRWVITAMVGRLARPGLFVTNLCRGGMLLRFADGVGRSLGRADVAAKKRALRRTTRTCVHLMTSAFPGIGQLGFDYAFDNQGRYWILEVNTRPH